MKNYALILASGKGERFGGNLPKQFLKINKRTVLEYSIDAFENNPNIDCIIIVSNPDFLDLTSEIVNQNNYKKVIKILAGGKTRKDSSEIGINAIEEDDAKVLIHDAVRPLVTNRIIDDCIKALDEFDAVSVAVKSPDTIVTVDEKNIIQSIPNRNSVRRNQTPQCFKLKLIKQAHKLANEQNLTVTDDCGLVINTMPAKIFAVDGEDTNIKITYPEDLNFAEKFLK